MMTCWKLVEGRCGHYENPEKTWLFEGRTQTGCWCRIVWMRELLSVFKVRLHFHDGSKSSKSDFAYPFFKIWWSGFKKLSIRQNQALPKLISKVWRSRFQTMSIRQNQALPYLISQIWRSRFNKLSIRQNHALPLLISKIWRSRFKRNVNPTKSGFALTIFQIFMDYRKIVIPTKSGSALPNF